MQKLENKFESKILSFLLFSEDETLKFRIFMVFIARRNELRPSFLNVECDESIENTQKLQNNFESKTPLKVKKMIFKFISLSITLIANVFCQIIQIPVARDNVI